MITLPKNAVHNHACNFVSEHYGLVSWKLRKLECPSLPISTQTTQTTKKWTIVNWQFLAQTGKFMALKINLQLQIETFFKNANTNSYTLGNNDGTIQLKIFDDKNSLQKF